MRNYLQEQSAGQLIRGSFEIYGKNFGLIFLLYVLPVTPVLFLAGWADQAKNIPLTAAALLLQLLVTIATMAAITVAISDVCLGNKPNLARSIRKGTGKLWWGLLWTNILVSLAFIGGFVLLIVPGIIFALWFFVAQTVVVIERVSGGAALKRSKWLTSSYNMRNFGVYVSLVLIAVGIGMCVGGVAGAICAFVVPDSYSGTFFIALRSVAESLAAPLYLIVIVLIYYDLRARKEGYDITMLAADLDR